MSEKKETLYLKADRNVIVTDRHVKLSDVAKLECADEAILRQLKQKKIYSFKDAIDTKKQKNERKVFSVLKLIQLIHEDYPNVDVSSEGEADFIVEYIPNPEKPKWLSAIKTAVLCIITFFGSAFTIMAFNNDISVNDLFSKMYKQVMGVPSSGVTPLEICYSIGLAIGICIFFNHVGRKKITPDPTPIQVEMRKYEKDVNNALVDTAEREGRTIDVE